MAYESSDILGGRSLENGKSNEASVFFKVSGIVALSLFAWMACSRCRVMFLKWKETRYKKAMRRRHGIPDEDERPFNVAYAAAVRARERGDSAPGGRRSRNALVEGQQSLRQRFNDVAPPQDTTSQWQNVSTPIIPQIAQAYAQIKQQQQQGQNNAQADPLNYGARYDQNPPTIQVTDSGYGATSLSHPTPSGQASKQKVQSVRKRSIGEDDDDFEPVKKSRVEGEELIDGNEDAAWAFKRGSKRGLSSDDDEGYESTRGDKRPRNFSRDLTPEDQVVEANEMDMDEITELRSIPRGKKRDRAEAGSTFGGDDDLDDQLDERNSRRRKRKMISKRKSDAQPQLRGKKRERDADFGASEDEEDLKRSANSRRRKGNKVVGEEDEASDESLNESLVSRGSYVKGRRIGEEWEVNGVLYKVGINGQRLRQALVKKARNRFPMPKDSQHPDREANLEVYVETWLTEDEYKEAKERQELAWQDTPKPSAEPETYGDGQDSPSVKGKNLLWASPAGHEPAAPKRRPFRESIATDLGLRINPFIDSQPAPRRRVVSAYGPLPAVGGGESPTRKGFRMFSKWEKQDLEAEAMAKMRAKLQEQKGMTPDTAKSIGLGAPPLAASASAPGPDNTGSTTSFFAKPPDKSGPTPVTASLSFGALPSSSEPTKFADTIKPSIFPVSTTPSSAANKSQPAVFGKLSGEAPSSGATPSLLFPPPMGSQSATSKSASAPDSAGGSSIPNFFGKKGDAAPALSSAPVPSSASAQQAQPSSTPKAPVFGFSAPISGFPSAASGSSTSTASPFLFSNNQSGKAPLSVFGNAQPDSQKASSEKPAQASEGSGSSSLLGRIGGFAPQNSTASQPPAAPSSTPSGSSFSFGKTDKSIAEPAKTTSVFGSSNSTMNTAKSTSIFGLSSMPSEPAKATPVFSSFNTATETASVPAKSTPGFGSTNTPQITPTGAATTPTPTPKFNFGFSNKTSSSGASSALGASSNSTTAPEPSKSSASAFGFSAPKFTPSSAPTDSPTPTTTEPKFKFGVTGGGSTFGSTSSLGSATATKSTFGGSTFGSTSTPGGVSFTANPEAAKSAFGVTSGGSTFGSTNPLGGASFSPNPAATKSAFNAYGSGSETSNPFSTTPASSPNQASKTSSSFGANGVATSSSTGDNKPADTPKSSFSSGGNLSSTAPSTTDAPNVAAASTASPFSFGFRNTSSTSNSTAPSPFGAQPLAGTGPNSGTQSVFGKPSTPAPSAFGFGNNTSSSSGAFNGFGQNQPEKK